MNFHVNSTLSSNNIIYSSSKGIVINATYPITRTIGSYFNTFINDTLVQCTSGCATDYYNIWLQNKTYNTTFLNVNFDKSKVYVKDSNLTIRWFLNINVSDINGIGISRVQVDINNSYANRAYSQLTPTNGFLSNLIITEYTLNGTVPFTIGIDTCTDLNNEPNIVCFTPYNISINKTGYGRKTMTIDINRSKTLNIILS